MHNVGIVVDGLNAAMAFSAELGLELVNKRTVEGQWVDRIVGLNGVQNDVAMRQTPDGQSRLELTKFRRQRRASLRELTRAHHSGDILIRTFLFVLCALTVCADMTHSQSKKPTLAVLDFRSTGGVSPLEAQGLSSRFRGLLAEIGAFTVVEREKMRQLLVEQDFAMSDACNTSECAVQVGQLLGVESMVAGDIGRIGQTYIVDIRLIDVSSGSIKKTARKDYKGEVDGLLPTLEQIARNISGSAITVFEERFDDNNRDWKEFSNNNAQFAVTNNSYVMESRIEGWWFSTKPITINQDEDFRIECSLKKIAGVDNFGYGLIWGLKDDKNYYHFVITGEGLFGIARVQEGNYTYIIPWATPNSINRYNSTNTLTVEKKGDQLQFLINESIVGKIKFEPFFGNRVGFTVWNKQTINFDDLIVTTYSK